LFQREKQKTSKLKRLKKIKGGREELVPKVKDYDDLEKELFQGDEGDSEKQEELRHQRQEIEIDNFDDDNSLSDFIVNENEEVKDTVRRIPDKSALSYTVNSSQLQKATQIFGDQFQQYHAHAQEMVLQT
jgi:hypothetical protein